MAKSPYLMVGITIIVCGILMAIMGQVAYSLHWTIQRDRGIGILFYAFVPSLLLLLTTMVVGVHRHPMKLPPESCRVKIKQVSSSHSMAIIFGWLLLTIVVPSFARTSLSPDRDYSRESAMDFMYRGNVEATIFAGMLFVIFGLMMMRIHAIVMNQQREN